MSTFLELRARILEVFQCSQHSCCGGGLPSLQDKGQIDYNFFSKISEPWFWQRLCEDVGDICCSSHIFITQLTCCKHLPHNFKRISKCSVLGMTESFPIEDTAGRLSPYTIVNFSMFSKPISTKIG